MAEPLLKVSGICKRFQGVEALGDIDIELAEGTIHGVVGPNGAGKTTLLNVISGYVAPNSGSVTLGDREITKLTPQQRVPLGVVRTFQNIRLFGGLSVVDNLLIGQHSRAHTGFFSLWPLRTGSEKRLRAEAREALELFDLLPYRKRRAAELPYGLQKQLEMARALAARPRVLLLDEPAAGMTTDGRAALVPRIRELRDRGMSVIVVEHDMDVIAKVCDHVTVLNFGRKLIDGAPAEVLASDEVRTAYLGT
ncbi:amino acid/amide ABC transporter ATP-binding protein 1 (HAAT family) [Actinophytocola oryzae]|uniref:Amino acid/amide ABC transporter ATP-binding protein 1 (HAAT family) n=1 Tax=Actinophytocola oryzae TaxID=502181 RepID=A0A4R7W1I9_9PSEU|nr:ABC transporter ATP-binding protein [Actinophytocola oryzae]TDV56430.1 amino acid/amide ABC transporter ATP-binding protein 1 (HAAT family) [Actinophytocola oryzae]